MPAMRLLSLFGLLLVGLALPAMEAAGQDWALDELSVRVELLDDGRYAVEESLGFTFLEGSFSQGFRSIPGRALDGLDGVTVESPDTPVEDLDVAREGDDFVITWSYPERSEPATFLLRYEVEGALLESDGDNIMDWDAVGDAWEVPIGEVQVELVWPHFDLDAHEVTVVPEEEGSLEDLQDRWRATFSPGGLEARTPYRVMARFPRQMDGAEPPASVGEEEGRFTPTESLTLLALLVLGFLPGSLSLLLVRNRRPSMEGPVEDPPELPLAEAAMLVLGAQYGTWRRRAFPAVLVDLARRKQVTLRAAPDPEATDEDEDQEILKVEVHPEPGSLTPFEERLVRELDQHGSVQAFQVDGGEFRKAETRAMREHLIQEGLVEDLGSRSIGLLVLSGVVLAAGLAVAYLASGFVAPTAIALGVGGMMGFGIGALKRERLTEAGSQARAHLEEFLKNRRTAVEDTWDRDPREAADLLVQHLHWLLLDTKVTGSWVERLRKKLEEAEVDLELPDWLQEAVGSSQADGTLVNFVVVFYLVIVAQGGNATPMGQAAVTTGSFSSAGVGASGGVGGGGGGVS